MMTDVTSAFQQEVELYDEMPFRKGRPDVDFFVDLAMRSGGPVLDLACGTGRITLPLASVADDVVGVDLVPEMLERAEAKARAQHLDGVVELLVGDMRSVRLGRRFPLVVMGGQPLYFLSSDEELRATLETVRLHLAEGGRWAAGVPMIRPEDVAVLADRMRFVCEIRHPRTSQRVAVWDWTTFDEPAQVLNRRRITEVMDEDGLVLQRRHSTQTLYYRRAEELQQFIREAGFTFEQVYGGYDGGHFGPGAEYLVWVATTDEGGPA